MEGGSAKDRKRAEEVRELQACLGYPGDELFKQMLDSGGILECSFTSKDVEKASKILGKSTIMYQGKVTAPAAPNIRSRRTDVIGEILHVDIMFIGGVATNYCFLIAVDEATGNIILRPMKSKSTPTLEHELMVVVGYYKNLGHKVKQIISDSENNFLGLSDNLLKAGVELVPRAPEIHSKRAERAIRTVKERARTILAGLEFRLPTNLYVHLMVYAANITNLTPNANTDGRCPREIVTGNKINLKRDLTAKFGDCGLFRIPKDRVKDELAPRAEQGIVVGRYHGNKGCLAVYIPSRDVIVRRTKFMKIPFTKELKETMALMNSKADIVVDWTEEVEEEASPEDLKPNASGTIDLSKDEESALNLSVSEALKSKDGKQCEEAIESELKNMLLYDVWKPEKTRPNARVIYSKMFVKRKLDSRGNLEKFKARLVAGGNVQDEDSYGNTAAPTVDQTSIMIALSIAAKYKIDVWSTDVPAAYLNAFLDEDIFMRINPEVSDILCKVDSSYANFRQEDGSIIVKLNKAIYGLKQSAFEWYQTLSGFMKTCGYRPCSKDRSVFIKRVDEHFSIVCVHVDDLLCVSNWNDELVSLRTNLMSSLKVKTFQKNNLSYLGMSIRVDKVNGKVEIDQVNYLRSYLEQYHQDGTEAVTPSNRHLFEVNDGESGIDQATFRSQVMSLMYVAKRSRPDILKEVTYLASRVSCPTEEDQRKLIRVHQYVKKTIGNILTLQPTNLILWASIDASYGIHPDMRGHSGLVLGLGGKAVILVGSKKQKLNVRSSSEGELVALDDGITYVLWARDLLEELGFDQGGPTSIQQDNKSTIIMAEKGSGYGGKSRHILNRYFFISDVLKDERAVLTYVPTEAIIADGLTKPIIGNKFRWFSDIVMGRTPVGQDMEAEAVSSMEEMDFGF
jgi:hypothetical protein